MMQKHLQAPSTFFLGLIGALFVTVNCTQKATWYTTSSGLEISIIAPGKGPPAEKGQWVLIHESTRLADGTTFLSTAGGNPLRIRLGANQVIDGVDEGVTGMRVGEKRKLVVPPHLSKRQTYPNALHPDDVLYYDLELVAIETQEHP